MTHIQQTNTSDLIFAPSPEVLSTGEYNHQYPTATKSDDGSVWIAWQCSSEHEDHVCIRRIDSKNKVSQIELSFDGNIYKPVINSLKNDLWIFASVFVNNKWSIQVRKFNDIDSIKNITKAGNNYDLCVKRGVDRLWAVWTNLSQGRAKPSFGFLKEGKWFNIEDPMVDSNWNSSPAIEPDGEGGLWAAWNEFQHNTCNVCIQHFRNNKWEKIGILRGEGEWNTSPSITKDSNGNLWVVWESCSANPVFLPRKFLCVRVLKKGEWTIPTSNLNHLNGAITFKGGWQGKWPIQDEHPYITCSDNGDIWVAWHTSRNHRHPWDIYAKYYKEGNWSSPIRITSNIPYYEDRPFLLPIENGIIWCFWQRSPVNGIDVRRNAEIVGRKICVESSTSLQDRQRSDLVLLENEAAKQKEQKRGTYIRSKGERVYPRRRNKDGLKLFWGDIHGHATLSDGIGSVEEYFVYAKKVANLDFVALTEHDIFPDNLTESEWRLIIAVANAFNVPGQFVTLYGYEWTSNEWRWQHGHKNIYYPGQAGSLLRSTDMISDTPIKLFNRVEQEGGLVFPHHVGVFWGSTDWRFHSNEIQRNVEICSSWGIYESLETKREDKALGCYVQDALEQGYRFGLIGGTDTHNLRPGSERGLTGIYTNELSRESIFEAFKNRYVYATTGARIFLEVYVNGSRMGEEQSLSKAPKNGIDILGRAEGTTGLAKIEIIKNNQVIYKLECKEEKSNFQFRDKNITAGKTNFYYVRVTQEDGEMAWSSPVWISLDDLK